METSGRKVHAIVEEKREELLALCRKHRVRRLALFGSAATGEFDPDHSDLDFVVDWEPMPPGKHGRHWLQMASDLEELFGRQVDIVTRDSMKNPFLREAVEETQVVLYGEEMPRSARATDSYGRRPRRVYSHLFNCGRACELLAEFIAGRTKTEYPIDRALEGILERQVEVLGRSLAGALRHDPSIEQAIPEARYVADFGPQLITRYWDIDHEAVWKIAHDLAPRIHEAVKALLAEVVVWPEAVA